MNEISSYRSPCGRRNLAQTLVFPQWPDGIRPDDTPSSSLDSATINTPSTTTGASTKVGNAECTTPNRTSSTFTIDGGVTSVPEREKTYMIRDMKSGGAVTLVDGRVTLELDAGTKGGWHWRCEEHPSGWIGFRNAVSASYLGRDNKGGFIAKAEYLKDWEMFVLRPRDPRGYNLLVKYGHTLKPMGISNDETKPKLVEVPTFDEAARWEFVEV
ncbi:hypothetical protein F5Y12DRAFT_586205 [Xylaria sp. FL1777]|nr:hypothetical protein F5Y12DRAFT_586205 [Xylaria sp. FL1777]